MRTSINVIAAVGLALGGALGLAGAMVTQQKSAGDAVGHRRRGTCDGCINARDKILSNRQRRSGRRLSGFCDRRRSDHAFGPGGGTCG